MQSIPVALVTKRISKGHYKVLRGTRSFQVLRYGDGMWGVYTDDDCLWVDQRLKDCKRWIQEQA